MSGPCFVVVHTLNGYGFPTFYTAAPDRWSTWSADAGRAWLTSEANATAMAAELNAEMPADIMSYYDPADHWRAEPAERWV